MKGNEGENSKVHINEITHGFIHVSVSDVILVGSSSMKFLDSKKKT